MKKKSESYYSLIPLLGYSSVVEHSMEIERSLVRIRVSPNKLKLELIIYANLSNLDKHLEF